MFVSHLKANLRQENLTPGQVNIELLNFRNEPQGRLSAILQDYVCTVSVVSTHNVPKEVNVYLGIHGGIEIFDINCSSF